MLIAHDPGHGTAPRVTGTQAGGLIERDWVLALVHDLVAATPWAQHLVLRTAAMGPTYAERAEAAERAGAALVIAHVIARIVYLSVGEDGKKDEEGVAVIAKIARDKLASVRATGKPS